MYMWTVWTVYLSIRGENPKEHAVRQELVGTICEHSYLTDSEKVLAPMEFCAKFWKISLLILCTIFADTAQILLSVYNFL